MNVVYELCQRAGLTQALLGKLADIPQGTISRYETGMSSPRLEMFEKLAAAVGCQIEVKLGEKSGLDSPTAPDEGGARR
jgi:transcriptional regulator with XRE-family HTH domain